MNKIEIKYLDKIKSPKDLDDLNELLFFRIVFFLKLSPIIKKVKMNNNILFNTITIQKVRL